MRINIKQKKQMIKIGIIIILGIIEIIIKDIEIIMIEEIIIKILIIKIGQKILIMKMKIYLKEKIGQINLLQENPYLKKVEIINLIIMKIMKIGLKKKI